MSKGVARLAAIGALLAAGVLAGYFLLGGDGGNRYRLMFETGGQLVNGNEVLIGGQPVGSVEDVKLTDDGQAEVTITTDRPLHAGSTAVIRSTSLSGIANRYVSIQPGPDNFSELPDDGVIEAEATTAAVDLDQLFATFDKPTRNALRDFIQGSSTVYAGRGPEANETYRYLSPALTATDELFKELTRDEQVLTDFLVSSSRVVTALGERRDDLSSLVTNANTALGAVAEQNESLDRALVALPPALRQANTTFANLRPTLDELDPLVATSKTATKDLAPFLRQLKPVAKKAVPVFGDLRLAVNRKRKHNDLADAMKDLGPLEANAASARQPSIDAMIDTEPVLADVRPYMPDVLGTLTKLGQITAYYDANGHYARVQPAGMNIFQRLGGGDLAPIPKVNQLADYGALGGANFRYFHRCPGGATQPAQDLSSPFLDGGNLLSPAPPNDCTLADVPLGP